jgi:(Z)-2-((N-methylformamido)methylene)-5-hydroxybutyrolactone dehydrogenase
MSTGDELKRYRLYIDGQWSDAAAGEHFESFNPYTGKPWALIPRADARDADRAVEAAHRAFTRGAWPALTATQRGALLRRLGDLIARDAEKLAAIEVRDNGKLIAEIGAQLRYIPQWFDFFGGLADKIDGAVLPIDKADMFTFTRREPVGVVAAITPWNSPLLLTAWKMAPALAAGCTMVIKPSEHTSASMLELAPLFEEAGFPPGVVNVVTGFGQEVGEPLTLHPKVDKIAFTGGEAGGRHVAHKAIDGGFKRLTLELGGKSPQIVFPDAKVDDAVKGVISGIFAATGQTCIAGSRLLVHESLHDEVVEQVLALGRTARMGDPMQMTTQVGPITTRSQYDRVLSYIDVATKEGANLALGGAPAVRPECGDGWFIEPTIFTGVSNTMRIAQEEVFGPLLAVIRFRDDEEAYAIANDSLYGLASGVWTTSMKRAFTASSRLRTGSVWINTYRAVSFLAPFGGFKRSGIGRENGQHAIDEYLETKTVWMSFSDETPNPFVMR